MQTTLKTTKKEIFDDLVKILEIEQNDLKKIDSLNFRKKNTLANNKILFDYVKNQRESFITSVIRKKARPFSEKYFLKLNKIQNQILETFNCYDNFCKFNYELEKNNQIFKTSKTKNLGFTCGNAWCQNCENEKKLKNYFRLYVTIKWIIENKQGFFYFFTLTFPNIFWKNLTDETASLYFGKLWKEFKRKIIKSKKLKHIDFKNYFKKIEKTTNQLTESYNVHDHVLFWFQQELTTAEKLEIRRIWTNAYNLILKTNEKNLNVNWQEPTNPMEIINELAKYISKDTTLNFSKKAILKNLAIKKNTKKIQSDPKMLESINLQIAKVESKNENDFLEMELNWIFATRKKQFTSGNGLFSKKQFEAILAEIEKTETLELESADFYSWKKEFEKYAFLGNEKNHNEIFKKIIENYDWNQMESCETKKNLITNFLKFYYEIKKFNQIQEFEKFKGTILKAIRNNEIARYIYAEILDFYLKHPVENLETLKFNLK